MCLQSDPIGCFLLNQLLDRNVGDMARRWAPVCVNFEIKLKQKW